MALQVVSLCVDFITLQQSTYFVLVHPPPKQVQISTNQSGEMVPLIVTSDDGDTLPHLGTNPSAGAGAR